MSADDRWLLVEAGLGEASLIDGAPLAAFTERHRVVLEPGERIAAGDVPATAQRHGATGVVVTLSQGLPGAAALGLMARVLECGQRCAAYWPAEQAVEVVDRIRLKSYRVHRRAHAVALVLAQVRAFLMRPAVDRIVRSLLDLLRRARRLVGLVVTKLKLRGVLSLVRVTISMRGALLRIARGVPPAQALIDDRTLQDSVTARLRALRASAQPVPLPRGTRPASAEHPLPGLGAYLRLDFWAPINSGGSFGHTCYVARHLARSSEDFTCFMAQPYALLDELGVAQVVVQPCPEGRTERDLILANDTYLATLRTVFAHRRPAYIYERLCLGSFVGAALSQEMGIPYILEYNGSEVSMARSFSSQRYEFEAVHELAEDAAFAQATLISVVSEAVRDAVVQRGVDPARILVNPNGAEPDVYAPPAEEERRALRASLGFEDEHCVVGFTGTFGGWHGIDVLAAALPRVCAADSSVRFLLVGDGVNKHLVDAAIAEHGLADRCVCTGRVPQQRGAVLLGACDVFVSPHSSHMVDSRFFGSPTKIFEYMSMGGGIVASDLEQIGEVLRPALTPDDFRGGEPQAGDARSVLTGPGDVDGLVDGVLALAARPALRSALGRNARQAVLDTWSWERHVERLWAFAAAQASRAGQAGAEQDADPPAALETNPTALPILQTGDRYKDEVQRQWNRDACGSHYVQGVAPGTLEWYLQAERYRFDEYGPWMPETMEFADHAGEEVLEIGAGMGTDLAQFARHGARTTDVDLSAGHLMHARHNFELRGLDGRFVHQDAETLPFDDASFDVVYSNGVIHHTPNTERVVEEIRRVLRPGGKAIVMVYAENSLHYWRNLFWDIGVKQGLLDECSMGEIMSRAVELSSEGQRPLVKAYTAERLRAMFARFTDVHVVQRQLTPGEVPRGLGWLGAERLGRRVGWNLVVKARRPHDR